jgi:L-glyceraldehyde 3-phosphate reductase
MGALKYAVDSGKAIYAGISSYPAEQTTEALDIAAGMGLDLLIHQPSYSMLNRWVEQGEPSLLDVLGERRMGAIVFSPLAQGLLTGKYLDGVPEDSRAARDGSFKKSFITPEVVERLRALATIAEGRGQTLAQMAIAWTLRDERVTSALIGASSVSQLHDSLGALDNLSFTDENSPRSTGTRWPPPSPSGRRAHAELEGAPTRRPSGLASGMGPQGVGAVGVRSCRDLSSAMACSKSSSVVKDE